MRSRFGDALALLFAPLLLAAVIQPENALAVVAISVTAIALARCVGMRMPVAPRGIGDRAAQHRHLLDAIPAPQHPRTPGRRRSRAPSMRIAAARPIT